ncbi:anaphase-promoting complex subunit 4-like [Limulus polyphemus]|uniref:Anaphase-promoting complex subunit 4 n=1 Tax=Limulus polyphemus TaxID=6850 RepID=A0ABM1AZM4_LIMPO|nr:anaphase-promoting complex subunit 4-like [Limulus polyphemus]
MCSFRQVDERHVPSEATQMVWSPTMDLIALATMQGEVLLHRLSWKKVWSLAPPKGKDNTVKVQVLVWRPDGKVLAVAYDTGTVLLCDVENSDVLHKIDVASSILCMAWVQKHEQHEREQLCYTDRSYQYLPKLPSLTKSYCSVSKNAEDSVEDSKKLRNQTNLNILLIGTITGNVLLNAFGVYPCGKLLVKFEDKHQNYVPIVCCSLSEDFSILSVIAGRKMEDEQTVYSLLIYSVPMLQQYHEELQIIALKYGQIACLRNYLSCTIQAIEEAWEDILLEIDSKLMTYAEEKQRVSSGTVSDGFLELLMFGTPSDVLEKFLLHDLTESGLKKLGHSIELSYSNIQKLVLKNLQCVAQAIYYHLNDMKGMALWESRFGALGLSIEVVKLAVMSTGSFLMKATEIQQVIDNSMKKFKAFFRWLYTVILRLSDEPIPPEITKVTQQDLNFVADFLKENFASEWDQEKKSTFSLERVGQYLKMEKLTFTQNLKDNPWITFLEAHPQFNENGMLFNHYPEKSLVQQQVELEKAVDDAFQGPFNVIGDSFVISEKISLFSCKTDFNLKTSYVTNIKTSSFYIVFIADKVPSSCMYIVREPLGVSSCLEAVCVCFGEIGNEYTESNEGTSTIVESPKKHRILDVQFYNDDILSVLLVENQDEIPDRGIPILVQFPLKNVAHEFQPIDTQKNVDLVSGLRSIIDGANCLDKMNYRYLESMRALQFAVSGSRKVACVLFSSRRRVRLFEMDVEDEEEDQDDTCLDESATREFPEREESGIIATNETIGEDDKENSFD